MTDTGDLRNDAFTLFCEEYTPDLQRFFLARGVLRHDCDDLVQECFIVHWEKLGRIRPEKSMSFLFGIASNLLKSYRRGQNSHAEKLRLFGEFVKSTLDRTSRFDEDELSPEMAEDIEMLTPRQHEVVDRIFLRGQSHEAVAAAMGVSSNALRQLKLRALANLRRVQKRSRNRGSI